MNITNYESPTQKTNLQIDAQIILADAIKKLNEQEPTSLGSKAKELRQIPSQGSLVQANEKIADYLRTFRQQQETNN